jgi:hypothetical protein
MMSGGIVVQQDKDYSIAAKYYMNPPDGCAKDFGTAKESTFASQGTRKNQIANFWSPTLKLIPILTGHRLSSVTPCRAGKA